MKKVLALVIITALLSCKKEKNSNSLVGTWVLTSIYQGYTMGGCMCWVNYSEADADVLVFYNSGKYKLTKPIFASSTGCSGNYRILSDTTIALTYECQMNPDQEIIRPYILIGNEFTITYNTIEGPIRYKYRRK